MAEIITRQLIDDIDGKPIDTGLGHEITFSYRGVDYRIDLRPANADKMDAALAPYIQVAEKVSTTGKQPATRAKIPGSGRSAEQLKAIRSWAATNGYGPPQRGRIKAETIAAFDAAH